MIAHRSTGLDALRGLAILMMVLSGVVPFGVLPSWMYHAQLPPPSHAFDLTLAGLTWVDLVFPMFLFAMGAAMPLALSRRLAQGISPLKLHIGILERGFLLAFFAIFLQHVRPFTISPTPDTLTWLTALLGMLVMFGIFTRFPSGWNNHLRTGLRVFAWLAAIAVLSWVTFSDGSGFRLTRSDIIILVLANMAVFGAWVWLATRDRLLIRLGVMAVLLACILSATHEGWVKSVWDSSPVLWLFRFYYLKYLFIIIPGTIAGEQLMRWSDASRGEPVLSSAGSRHYITVLLMLMLILVLVVGLHSRLVALTVTVSVVLGWILWRTLKHAEGPGEATLRQMIGWGLFWVALGLCFEPFEGGIKKDISTFSYYFVTAGISVFLLTGFVILIDGYGRKRWFPLLVENGQNPMIAYVGMMNFLYPLLGLTGLHDIIVGYTAHPWLGVLRALVYTLILAALVAWLTRRGVVWKT